jgi:hypothetical protein
MRARSKFYKSQIPAAQNGYFLEQTFLKFGLFCAAGIAIFSNYASRETMQ